MMALGGHQAVRDEVVEDLALAQRTVRAGRRMSVHMAEGDLATRMYRSLGDLVAGWSKNIFTGGLQSMPPRLRPFIAPLSVLVGSLLWLLPPLGLVVALLGVGNTGLLAWSALSVGTSVVLFSFFTSRMGAPVRFGALYPLGAAVGMYIFLRAWRRGRRVEWKGRTLRAEGHLGGAVRDGSAKASGAALAERVRAEARALGFSQVGVVRPDPSDHIAFYRKWLAAGHHGEMRYLARGNAVERRADLAETLPNGPFRRRRGP